MDLVLEPKRSALVAIDLQHAIVARELAPYSATTVVENCVGLASALRGKGGAIVFVHVIIPDVVQLPVDAPTPRPANLPPEASQLVPQLHLQQGDLVVTKRSWGAFYGTDLDLHLRRGNIKTIVMGGIATNFGVESTARAAFDRAYELIFVEDAMSSMSADMHEFSIKKIFPRMGKVRSTAQVLEALR